jgi:hypothetical protein
MCVAVSSKKRQREISKETNINRKLRKIWVINCIRKRKKCMEKLGNFCSAKTISNLSADNI